MLVGRFFMIVPVLAIAGSLAAKKIVPAVGRHLPDHGGLFVGLLVGVILIVGGLTFFPALALGPIVEHLAMHRRHTCSDRDSELHPWNLKPQADAGLGDARPDDPVAGDRRRLRQARSAADDHATR